MTENKDALDAGAPIDETAATETDIAAAVARAQENDLSTSAEDAAAQKDAAELQADELEAAAAATVVDVDAENLAAARAEAAEAELAEADPVAEAGAEPETAAAAEPAQAEFVKDDDIISAAAPEDINTRPYTAAEAAEVAEAAAAQNDAAVSYKSDAVVIDKDHPMGGFFTQAPVPPELRGNRGAGIAISALATVIFAAVYAGIIALFELRYFHPATLATESNLLAYLTSPGYFAAIGGFFIGMVLLVLVFGRAGWWAYVLGGFAVGVLTWLAATAGFVVDPKLVGVDVAVSDVLAGDATALLRVVDIASILRVIAAGLVAREVAVWFGAWIGARGRKMTRENREALAEYDAAVAEYEA